MKPFSVNQSCIAASGVVILFSVVFLAVVYRITGSMALVCGSIGYVGSVFLVLIGLIVWLRRQLVVFSDMFCRILDQMLDGEIEEFPAVKKDQLFDKICYRLMRLYEVLSESRIRIARERKELQELISDISHQVKTPIANLKIVNATLLEQPMERERQQEFLTACGTQIDKLDFLMQAMIKTSRLEAGVISLKKQMQTLYETLAEALGEIFLNAEKKGIQIQVNCPEQLKTAHDRKWTKEAFFNLLDNAVKYTPDNGKIWIDVESWEMYAKVTIKDNGKGIAKEKQGTIFQRFYREEEVHEIEGIGIGLYLAREIITMQGGYIMVVSEVGEGAAFSVFLPYL